MKMPEIRCKISLVSLILIIIYAISSIDSIYAINSIVSINSINSINSIYVIYSIDNKNILVFFFHEIILTRKLFEIIFIGLEFI